MTLVSFAEANAALRKERAKIDALRRALEFYADPMAWKEKHDPINDIQVPDFYSETSFGDTARAALDANP